jgi:hypothetical protein
MKQARSVYRIGAQASWHKVRGVNRDYDFFHGPPVSKFRGSAVPQQCDSKWRPVIT